MEFVTEIAALFPPQGAWTEADYFALPESNQLVELANGELTVTPSPSGKHALVVMELANRLKNHADRHKLGAVMVAPMDVRLFPGTIRQPDVLFIRQEHRDRIGDYVDGPPDWVAEVISRGTRRLDKETKVDEYSQAGVPEYWLVDPENDTLHIYTLADETYGLAATVTAGQTARSETIPGFEIPLDDLFAAG